MKTPYFLGWKIPWKPGRNRGSSRVPRSGGPNPGSIKDLHRPRQQPQDHPQRGGLELKLVGIHSSTCFLGSCFLLFFRSSGPSEVEASRPRSVWDGICTGHNACSTARNIKCCSLFVVLQPSPHSWVPKFDPRMAKLDWKRSGCGSMARKGQNPAQKRRLNRWSCGKNSPRI